VTARGVPGVPGFTGELIAPGDERYDEARSVWNAAIDRYPALIARARGTADVTAVIRYAQDSGLPLSVRGGGHSAAGLAVADGALMLDLSAMKAVAVDPAARTAVAAPGVTWGELDAATQSRALATTGGVVGSTGIAGLTLGGGIGWLDRLAGLTCDNLVEAKVVTADGRVRTASGTEHPDLFWALRGGGGNFGVVTSFRYRLHPVTSAYGGLLGYTFDHAADVLRAYLAASEDAPGRLALYAGMTTAPPLPFIPERLHGQPLAALFPVCFGTADDHPERAVAAVRALLPPPAVDATGPMSYRQVQQFSEGPGVPGWHHYYTAEWLDVLDDKVIDALVGAASRATSPRSIIVVKRMGGAAARVPADGTAFWYRRAAHNLDIHAQWAPGGDPAAHRAWAHAARQAVRHASAGGGYVNFLGGDQGADRVRAAYAGNYRRLTEVKAAYDPANFFRLNHNIPPAGFPCERMAAHTSQRSGPPGAGS
jgi:FAD/FMN-containing dehydrogenase